MPFNQTTEGKQLLTTSHGNGEKNFPFVIGNLWNHDLCWLSLKSPVPQY